MKNSTLILKKSINKITRKELFQELNISQPAISKIIKKLIDKNYLIEFNIDSSNKIGRIPKYLKINPNIGELICLYFNLDSIKVGIYNFNCTLLSQEKIILNKNKNILNSLYKVLDKLFEDYNILGLSIGMNGIVNNQEGVVIKSTFYNWKNYPLKSVLKKRYKTNVVIENGANLIALHEKKIGKALTNENFMVINISDGVGASIFLENKLYKGKFYDVGEIGHTPFDYTKNALICSCGNKGCLETLIANWRVEEKVKKLTGKNLDFTEIVEISNRGKNNIRDILLETLTPLSHIIIWTTSILSFEKIIIKGKITRTHSFFLDELKRQVKKNILNKEKKIIIEFGEYNKNNILDSAALLGIEHIIENLN